MGEKLKSYVILPKASRLNNVLSKISTVDEDGEECEEYYEESYIRPNICYNSSEKIHDYIDWLCSVQKEKDRKELLSSFVKYMYVEKFHSLEELIQREINLIPDVSKHRGEIDMSSRVRIDEAVIVELDKEFNTNLISAIDIDCDNITGIYLCTFTGESFELEPVCQNRFKLGFETKVFEIKVLKEQAKAREQFLYDWSHIRVSDIFTGESDDIIGICIENLDTSLEFNLKTNIMENIDPRISTGAEWVYKSTHYTLNEFLNFIKASINENTNIFK